MGELVGGWTQDLDGRVDRQMDGHTKIGKNGAVV